MDRVRVDKWLWAARFYKTRSLATQAVDGGKVKVNGERIKPSKELRVGDRVWVHAAEAEWLLTVLALADKRGPATVARTLYEEDAEAQRQRLARIAERKLRVDPGAEIKGRPTKRDRRLIHRFTDG